MNWLGLTDENGTPNDGGDATAQEAIENDGQGLVDDDVCEEEGDEDPVLALA